MSETLGNSSLSSWGEISELLNEFKDSVPTPPQMKREDFFRLAGKGTAFSVHLPSKSPKARRPDRSDQAEDLLPAYQD